MYNKTMNTHNNTDAKAYAIAYQTNDGPMGSDRRLMTPAYTTVELALGYLYTMVAEWHWAEIKTVPHTDQTRDCY